MINFSCNRKIKYFNKNEISLLREKARSQNPLIWMVVDLLTQTGLRVFESASLKVGDLRLDNGNSKILIGRGKGGYDGEVVISDSLKQHLLSFLEWKRDNREKTNPESPLFIGQRGPLTRQGIQQIVKKLLKSLNLYESGKAVHSLRHSYAVMLYSRKKDLRCVQKQLRHRSISSTLVYADVADDEIKRQVNSLF